MFSNVNNLNDENLLKENKLVTDLEQFFPEKFLKLIGSDFDISDLQAFLKEKSFTDSSNFDVDEFLIFVRNSAIVRRFQSYEQFQQSTYNIMNTSFGSSVAAITSTKVWV